MKPIRTSEYDAVLSDIQETYPNYKLCSHENLGRICRELEITNEPRFWNERSKEILQAIQDINVTFHRYPDFYKNRILASKELESLFDTQIFPHLVPKIKDMKNADPKDVAMMVKICSNFLRIGLSGLLQSMPSDFTYLLEPKIQEVFSIMSAINSYTQRIAPRYAKSIQFPFDMYEKIIKKQVKKEKKKT